MRGLVALRWDGCVYASIEEGHELCFKPMGSGRHAESVIFNLPGYRVIAAVDLPFGRSPGQGCSRSSTATAAPTWGGVDAGAFLGRPGMGESSRAAAGPRLRHPLGPG